MVMIAVTMSDVDRWREWVEVSSLEEEASERCQVSAARGRWLVGVKWEQSAERHVSAVERACTAAAALRLSDPLLRH